MCLLCTEAVHHVSGVLSTVPYGCLALLSSWPRFAVNNRPADANPIVECMLSVIDASLYKDVPMDVTSHTLPNCVAMAIAIRSDCCRLRQSSHLLSLQSAGGNSENCTLLALQTVHLSLLQQEMSLR
jgi:hypothetical protein